MLPRGSELAAALGALPDLCFPDLQHCLIVSAAMPLKHQPGPVFGYKMSVVHFLFTFMSV
jgi:hypothetical protein